MSRDFARETVEILTRRGLSLSLAESCTGGMIGAALTAVPGSSTVLWGGFILYSNEAKINLAGVDRKIIEECGAVSQETVTAMADGAKKRCDSDYALAVSGIAGPGGGTKEKPVGTVWIGLAGPDDTEGKEFIFPGNRDDVRKQTVDEALKMLLTSVNKNESNNN